MRVGEDSPAGRLARRFRESGPPGIVSAYLFGSQATGRAHRESDVDVGVLLARSAYSTAPARFEARLSLIGDLQSLFGRSAVDVVVLNDVPATLGRHIVTEGRRVYCADPVADHSFVRDVQLRAADLEPFLRRTRRRKLEGLGR
jgi:predicted nucleotidyltransferase